MVGPSIGVSPSGADRCPTVLVVGAASRDLDPTDPRGWRLGGGVTYGSMAAAGLGVRVRALIGVDREASTARELEMLAGAGVEVEPLLLDRGPVFDNVERSDGRVQICHEVSDRMAASALPAAWRSPEAVVFAPVAGELGPPWARAVPSGPIVGLGWQGLLRRLTPGQTVESVPARPSALLRRADIVVASVEDLRAGGPRLDLLVGRPGQQLLITNRASPALYLRRFEMGLVGRLVPTLPVESGRSPTGAGDVLLSTWVAGEAALRCAGQLQFTYRVIAVAMTAAGLKVASQASSAVSSVDEIRLKVAELRLANGR